MHAFRPKLPVLRMLNDLAKMYCVWSKYCAHAIVTRITSPKERWKEMIFVAWHVIAPRLLISRNYIFVHIYLYMYTFDAFAFFTHVVTQQKVKETHPMHITRNYVSKQYKKKIHTQTHTKCKEK